MMTTTIGDADESWRDEVIVDIFLRQVAVSTAAQTESGLADWVSSLCDREQALKLV